MYFLDNYRTLKVFNLTTKVLSTIYTLPSDVTGTDIVFESNTYNYNMSSFYNSYIYISATKWDNNIAKGYITTVYGRGPDYDPTHSAFTTSTLMSDINVIHMINYGSAYFFVKREYDNAKSTFRDVILFAQRLDMPNNINIQNFSGVGTDTSIDYINDRSRTDMYYYNVNGLKIYEHVYIIWIIQLLKQ